MGICASRTHTGCGAQLGKSLAVLCLVWSALGLLTMTQSSLQAVLHAKQEARSVATF